MGNNIIQRITDEDLIKGKCVLFRPIFHDESEETVPVIAIVCQEIIENELVLVPDKDYVITNVTDIEVSFKRREKIPQNKTKILRTIERRKTYTDLEVAAFTETKDEKKDRWILVKEVNKKAFMESYEIVDRN